MGVKVYDTIADIDRMSSLNPKYTPDKTEMRTIAAEKKPNLQLLVVCKTVLIINRNIDVRMDIGRDKDISSYV